MSQLQKKERSNPLITVVAQYVLGDIKELYRRSEIVTSFNVKRLPQLERSELQLGKLLGEGSFSRAYELESIVSPPQRDLIEGNDLGRTLLVSKLRQRRHGKSPLVVKLLRPKFSKSPDKFRAAARDLVKEAAFLACLQHPNIISIRGVAAHGALAYSDGSTDGFFIVMDRIECTLFERMHVWKTQLDQYSRSMLEKIGQNYNNVLFAGRLEVIRDIASALVFLHERRLVFRDVKPNNVGFDANGNVKLIDFGMVIEIPRQGGIPTSRGGTLRYMARECYLERCYGQNVDVYSLAIVLWEVLALCTFFPDYTRDDFVRNVVQMGERPPTPEEWPTAVKLLVQKGWSHQRHQRPSMKQFHQAIEHELTKLKSSKCRGKQEGEICNVVSQKDNLSTTLTESTKGSGNWMKDIFFMMHPYRT